MKRDILTKIICVSLFMSSFVMSALWLAGYVEEDTLVNKSAQLAPTSQETIQPQFRSFEEWMDELLDKSNDMLYERNRAEEWTEIQAETEAWYREQRYSMLNQALEASKSGDEQYLQQGEALDREIASDLREELTKEASIQITSAEIEEEETVHYNGSFDLAYDLSLVESDIDLPQFETRTVVATGYTAGYESTGKHPDHPQYGLTFSGVQVRRDLYSTIAADPTIFPIGTILYIPGYGYGIVADTGGAIKGNKIDLYYETVEDVFNLWGKRTLDVYVISYGEGYVTEAMLDHYNHHDVVQVYLPKR